jgi:hypothetical protein
MRIFGKIYFIFLFIVFYCSGGVNSYATTYYISPTGSDVTGAGTTVDPWATIHKGISAMSGGDTLILKDGTYTGADNTMWRYTNPPPVGSAGTYTIIKAEHDGGAILDGQNVRDMLWLVYDTSIGNKYWQFEGLLFARALSGQPALEYCARVKFLRCGAFDVYNTGNYYNFSFHYCSYVLLEGCYSYGSGRYKFLVHSCDHMIYRNCVGRMDPLNAGGEPAAIFGVYTSTYCEVQNCIAIDSDQDANWVCGDRQGSFFVPCTNGPSDYVNFTNCIGLNVKLGGLVTAHNYDSAHVIFDNCVIWKCGTAGFRANAIGGSYNTIKNCTFGVVTSDRFMSWQGLNGTLKNNIIYGAILTDHLLYFAPATQDYNNFYDNDSDYDTTETHKFTRNPIYNTSTNPTGSLKYITCIESGSNLSGQGESGADIGANVKTLIGTAGTLWGETGYNADTGVSMWPFPNEDLIRTKMKTYSGGGVSGNRGFCVDGQTLTTYIWEYLGNTIPFDAASNLVAEAISSSQIGLSWTDNSFYENGFKIERKKAADVDYTQIATVVSNVTTYADTGLTVDTEYSYRVRSYRSTTDSSYTNEATAITNEVAAINDNSVAIASSGGGGGGGCFIATAAFGTPMAKEVVVLSRFRDNYLLANEQGKRFVQLYYAYSPSIADYIRSKESLKKIIRTSLKPLLMFAEYVLPALN